MNRINDLPITENPETIDERGRHIVLEFTNNNRDKKRHQWYR